LITGEELAAMGDIGRCELIDGRIVRMPPTGDEHGSVEGNFYAALRAFNDDRRTGKVRVGEVGIYTRRSPDRVRGADVLYISNERWSRRDPDRAFLDVAPEIVVEILSPDDRAADVVEKVHEYLAMGVKLVWLGDPRTRVVSVWSGSSVRELHVGDTLTGEDVLPGFAVPVAELFIL
jgi:Uma2 family endonuclease